MTVRPAGVTLAARVLAAASVLTLVAGTLGVIRQFQNIPLSEFAGFAVLGGLLLAVMVLGLVIWEAATVVGLWRTRPWSRTSALLLCLLLLPAHSLAGLNRYFRPGHGSVWFDAFQVALALAGALYFLQPGVRRAFEESQAQRPGH